MWAVASLSITLLVTARGSDRVSPASPEDGARSARALRGGALLATSPSISGWGTPTWGGRSFDDSLANFNGWKKERSVPVVTDLNPIAPLDRLDLDTASITDAMPLEPSTLSAEGSLSSPPTLRNEWIGRYYAPRTFPAAVDHAGFDSPTEMETPIDERPLVAAKDKLRPPDPWRTGNYPLVAPGDRIIASREKVFNWFVPSNGPWPVAAAERVDHRFAKYFEQVEEEAVRRRATVREDIAFEHADTNGDGRISYKEYLAEMASQNKTEKESERIWKRIHNSRTSKMDKAEFAVLVRSAYDMGTIPREDITSMLPFVATPSFGFWGSGAACLPGSFVVGARLKVATPKSGVTDNTGLNGIGLRCSTGKEVKTVEGSEGEWTSWAECPRGQQVYSVRAKLRTWVHGGDNTGIESLELGCRAPDLSAMSKLRFGGGKAAVALGSGSAARGGSNFGAGWSKEQMCNSYSAVCGAQAHVVRGKGTGDDMGVSNLRVYCCKAPVDCKDACSRDRGGPGSVGCQVCRKAAGRRPA